MLHHWAIFQSIMYNKDVPYHPTPDLTFHLLPWFQIYKHVLMTSSADLSESAKIQNLFYFFFHFSVLVW